MHERLDFLFPPAVEKRRMPLLAPLAAVALATLIACGRDEGGDTTTHTLSGSAPAAVAPAAPGAPIAATVPPPGPPTGCGDVSLHALTEPDRLDAMLVVQTAVLTWDPDVPHVGILSVPPPSTVGKALDRLRCDQSPRATSRHSRAIAKFLGMDWNLVRAKPYLIRLGFTDVDAIDQFKAAVVAQFGASVFALHAHDPGWVEYAVTRLLTTTALPPGRVSTVAPGLFGPALAHADGSSSCWEIEEPWEFTPSPTSVYLGGHVSVVIDPTNTEAAEKARVQGNVDPQQWNVCGRFWSPPDPNNSSAPPLDGAVLVKSQWKPTGPCTIPTKPFNPPDSIPDPGDIYDTHYLFEQFFVRTQLGNAWFENILSIEAQASTRSFETGLSVPSHLITYALGLCGTLDNVEGAMGGAIFGTATKTVLDGGSIEVWYDGGRTHVRAHKTFELTGGITNWLTRLNPELHELNEELGELACCL